MSEDRLAGLRTFKLFVAVPSGEYWHRLFGTSLAMMIGELACKPVLNYQAVDFRIHNVRGSILPRSRERLTDLALAWGASHMLFVDSDMAFPSDLVHRLAAHQKWIMACNCATKQIPASTTARLKSITKQGGEPVYSDKSGIEKVWRVGTGVMLIDMRVFLKIKKPWFPITWIPEINNYEGEDWGFCRKAEEAGLAIYVDHDASRLIGHAGEMVYSHDLVGEVVQAPVDEPQAVNG